MSKEQTFATPCVCGLMITFIDQHLQHCKGGNMDQQQDRMNKKRRRRKKKP